MISESETNFDNGGSPEDFVGDEIIIEFEEAMRKFRYLTSKALSFSIVDDCDDMQSISSCSDKSIDLNKMDVSASSSSESSTDKCNLDDISFELYNENVIIPQDKTCDTTTADDNEKKSIQLGRETNVASPEVNSKQSDSINVKTGDNCNGML